MRKQPKCNAVLCLDSEAEKHMLKSFYELKEINPELHANVSYLLDHTAVESVAQNGSTLRMWKDYPFCLGDPGEQWLAYGPLAFGRMCRLLICIGEDIDNTHVSGNYLCNPFGLTLSRKLVYSTP
jgi:hypothetical protein